MLHLHLAYIGPGVVTDASGEPAGLWLAIGIALALVIAVVLRRSLGPHRQWKRSFREVFDVTLLAAGLGSCLLLLLATILFVAVWPTIGVSVVGLALIWTLIWMGLPWWLEFGERFQHRLVVRNTP